MLQFLKRKKMEGGDIHWLNEILGILSNSFNSGLKFWIYPSWDQVYV